MAVVKTELNRLAYLVANQADAIETDVAHIEDADDIQSVLSHVEILQGQVQALRTALRDAIAKMP